MWSSEKKRIILLFLILCPGGNTGCYQTDEAKSWEPPFKDETMKDYNKAMSSLEPIQFSEPPLQVSYYLTKLLDMNQKAETVKLAAQISIVWTDTRLVGANTHAENMSVNRFDERSLRNFKLDDIWFPNIVHYNSVVRRTGILDINHRVVAMIGSSNIVWTRNVVLTSPCEMDVTYFPVDRQICKLEFNVEPRGSMELMGVVMWDRHAELQDLKYYPDAEWEVRDIRTGQGWEAFSDELISGKINRSKLERIIQNISTKTSLTIEHTFHRKYQHYLFTILAPVTLLSVLVLSVFLIPPDAGEKISLGITLLLTFQVFQMTVGDDLPVSSNSTPLIVKAMFLLQLCSAMSILASVLVLHVYHITSERGKNVPRWLRWLFFNVLAKITCHYESVKRMKGLGNHNPTRKQVAEMEEVVVWGTTHANHTNTLEDETTSSQDFKQAGSELKVLLDIRSLLSDLNPRTRAVREDADSSSEWKLFAQILDRVLMYACLGTMSAVYITLFVQLHQRETANHGV